MEWRAGLARRGPEIALIVLAAATQACAGCGANDPRGAGVLVTPPLVTCSEAGGTATFEVALQAKPNGKVTLELTSDLNRALLAGPRGDSPSTSVTLTFTRSNWQSAQRVTVLGVDDTEALGVASGTIAIAVVEASTESTDHLALSAVDLPVVTVLLTDDEIVYVSAIATGANDGSSWTDAVQTVQAGVDAAAAGEQVWVAAGIYVAGEAAGAPVLTMKSGVGVHGGFVGDELTLAERPAELAQTVLSGDFAGDDHAGARAENTPHVVLGASNAHLEGFTVRGGEAGFGPEDVGGGMLNSEVSGLTLHRLRFEDNRAYRGGAVYNQLSSVAFTNVTFAKNDAATRGGGLYENLSDSTLEGVTFVENSSGSGGGVFLSLSDTTLVDCAFVRNSANYGGAFFLISGGSPTIADVLFAGNRGFSAGGAVVNQGGTPSLQAVHFVSNEALGSGADGGGAIYGEGGEVSITDASFHGNKATRDGGAIWVNAGVVTIARASFYGNSASADGGAIRNGSGVESNVVIDSSVFWSNLGTNGADVSGLALVTGSAADQMIPGNVDLASDPFELAASGEVFLMQDAALGCVDGGTGAELPLGWSSWTTSLDARADSAGAGAPNVDLGCHYRTNQAWISTLEVTADDVSWTTHGATTCALTNDAVPTRAIVDAAALASGSLLHGLSTGATLRLRCEGAAGHPALAAITVP